MIRRRDLAASFAVLSMAASCLAPAPKPIPRLANAEVTSDFHSYDLRRVGLLPFEGRTIEPGEALELQRSFLSEVERATPYEIVLLNEKDLEMIDSASPHRRGWYDSRTIIELSRRYNLDALMFGTVTEERFFPPQVLSLSVDLVSAETGLVIWTSSVHLDASDPRVRTGLQAYYGTEEDESAWRLALLSPERFSRFAAYQIAAML
ncbi:MAG TPA: hypothetical protein ENJ09_14895 [Planctomycetes bacterium]|nr:hypothetical protein [Planctomycetota bacterium]